MLYRLILPEWARASTNLKKVVEGELTEEQLTEYNKQGYNCYFLPNQPSEYNPEKIIDGADIDLFNYCFVDLDMKDYHSDDPDRSHNYDTKEAFVDALLDSKLPPTTIVDSGNGVHAYWKVSDLDVHTYLRLQKRLCRYFKTDPEVSKIFQLMRVPNTINTKHEGAFKLCEVLESQEVEYSCEQMNSILPGITLADEEYCKQHYEKTYNINQKQLKIEDKIPIKFAKLIRENQEVKSIWSGNTDDRSKTDYRLGHIMFASGFSKEEALSVLVNSAKALTRAPKHRVSYASNIVDKIWTFENTEDKSKLTLSSSVKDILARNDEETLKGTRFPCWRYFDATEKGFRLTQVIGLVAGSGVGKSATALNMFKGFVQYNPDYIHFFVPLEQPDNEIAERWKRMCGDQAHLHDKVEIISNYDQDGSFRNLSLDDIKDYIIDYQAKTGKKAGVVVIDHIGALKKKTKDGENQGLMDLCHAMKAFAIATNTLLIMQSQAPREKAGIGDLELNKDAAYGTVYFESYCDYLITLWQPLKRKYDETACPTVTAFKFCKIRHKNKVKDEIQEDQCYRLFFDPDSESFRELTQDEEKSFDYFNAQCTNLRKADRKTTIVPYKSMHWMSKENDRKANNN